MFGSSVFLCLGVCLVLFGIFGYLISIKLNEQNDKIKNMVDLICTITNDLQLIKLQHATTTVNTSENNTAPSDNIQKSLNNIDTIFIDKLHSDINTSKKHLLTGGSNSIGDICGNIKKIVVSDCELSDDDDEDDDDLDDEETNEDEESDMYESDTKSNVDYSFDSCSVNDTTTTKDITFTNLEKQEPNINTYILEKDSFKIYSELENVSLDEDDEENVNKSLSDSITTNLSNDIIQCVLIEEESEKSNIIPVTPVSTKTIVVDLNADQPTDYHKMSIHQLRKIAIERNLIDSSSKLKKNEILKLFTI
jgi:hypothetical protein